MSADGRRGEALPLAQGASEAELVPLRTDFDVVWRGYDQDQVRHYVRCVEEELRLVAADRDAAVSRAESFLAHLEALRSENRQLQARVDRICRTPIEPDTVPERLGRMVELARAEAQDITRRAEAQAEQTWAAAREAAARLRTRQENMLADLDRRRSDMEAEHRELIGKARSRVDAMVREAEQRRRELDERAARHRRQVEHDFRVAMAERRATAMRECDERVAAAKAEAERVLAQARDEARHLVDEARREARSLRDIRDRIAEQVTAARAALAAAAPLLEAEHDPAPTAGELHGDRAPEMPDGAGAREPERSVPAQRRPDREAQPAA